VTGHVFVVGADLRRLVCDDVLVPTDRTLRVTAEWRRLLPDDVVTSEDRDGVCLGLDWHGGERVLEVPWWAGRRPGDGRCGWWDTVDQQQRDGDDALRWLVDGAREALAAIARREVPTPVHGGPAGWSRCRRWAPGGAGPPGSAGTCCSGCCRCCARARGARLRRRAGAARPQRPGRGAAGARAGPESWDLPSYLRELAEDLGERARRGQLAAFVGAGVSAAAGLPTWEQLLDELAGRSGLDDDLRAGCPGCRPRTPRPCWPASSAASSWRPSSRSGSGPGTTRWRTR
jgi:hypothetical protein